MTITGQRILDKCREHLASGGLLLSGSNGVHCVDPETKRPIHRWEFKSDTGECCPLGAVLEGTEAHEENIELDAAMALDTDLSYTDSFIMGFDNPQMALLEIGGRDAVEIREILESEGVKIRDAMGE